MITGGLIGGLGPESTIDYYRRIMNEWKVRFPGTLPSLVLDSLDVNRAIRLVQSDRRALADYLRSSVSRLQRAGCDFAAIAANTPHIVFDDVVAGSRIPLVSIVQTCADYAAAEGIRRVGLLGTGFTMAADFFPTVFARLGVDVRVPGDGERAWLHDRYLGELLDGVFLDTTRAGVVAMIEDLARRQGVDAIVLAGTELPLLLRAETVAGLPILDTTDLHVHAIVERLSQARQAPRS